MEQSGTPGQASVPGAVAASQKTGAVRPRSHPPPRFGYTAAFPIGADAWIWHTGPNTTFFEAR